MFSIIIPLYNKEFSIINTIQSVLEQTFQDFEIVVVNDGSTDKSAKIVEAIDDKRIRLIHQENQGVSAARNKGIKEAKYEWICFLDADDLWKDNYLQIKEKVIEDNSTYDIISSEWVNKKNSEFFKNPEYGENKSFVSFSLIDFMKHNFLMWTGAVVIRKSLLMNVGLFPIKCSRGEDFDTWIRCLYHSRGNIYIKQVLSIYFREGENKLTDRSINLPRKICSTTTLNRIRSENYKNQFLLKAIDKFLAKKTYEILKGVDLSNKEKKKLLKNINSIPLREKIKIKLLIRRVLANIGVLKKLK